MDTKEGSMLKALGALDALEAIEMYDTGRRVKAALARAKAFRQDNPEELQRIIDSTYDSPERPGEAARLVVEALKRVA